MTATKETRVTPPPAIALDLLDPSADNPRKKITAEGVADLARSIRELGVLQPILVRPKDGGRFEIVAGHRRVAAAKLAGLDSIPYTVREISDDVAQEARIAENVAREGLDPLAEALAIAKRAGEGRSPAEIGNAIGKPTRYVERRMTVANLSPKLQDQLRKGTGKLARFTAEQLELLAALPPREQLDVVGMFRAGDEIGTGWLKRTIANRLRGLSLAPWKLDDEALYPKAGACTTCPHNSANRGALFPELASQIDGVKNPQRDPICHNAACWKEKLKRQGEAVFAKAQEEHGTKVVAVERGYRRDDTTIPHPDGTKLLQDWEVRACRKGTAGAVPAIDVNGGGAGRLRWIVPNPNARDRNRGAKAKAKPKPGTKEDLAAKRLRLRNRRRAHVIDAIRKAVEKAGAPSPDTILALAAGYGVAGPGVHGHKGRKTRFDKVAKGELAELWSHLRREILPNLARHGMTDVDAVFAESTWIAGLVLEAGFGDTAMAKAEEEIRPPATLTKLEAELAGKKGPARKASKAKATKRKAVKRKAVKRKAVKRKAAKKKAGKKSPARKVLGRSTLGESA